MLTKIKSLNKLPFILRNFHLQITPHYKSFKDWYRSLWIPKSSIEPPYSHVVQIGDPVLRQKSELVPNDLIQSKEIDLIVKQMIYVLRKYNCVGLAASQIGVPLNIIVMEFSEKLKKEFPPDIYKIKCMETLPLTVIINPTLKIVNYNKKTFLESCASVCGYAGEVDRYEEIELNGHTLDNEQIKLNLKGWNARIAQHECDHTNGTIYTDKMNRSSFICTCWHRVNTKGGRIEIPFYPK